MAGQSNSNKKAAVSRLLLFAGLAIGLLVALGFITYVGYRVFDIDNPETLEATPAANNSEG